MIFKEIEEILTGNKYFDKYKIAVLKLAKKLDEIEEKLKEVNEDEKHNVKG